MIQLSLNLRVLLIGLFVLLSSSISGSIDIENTFSKIPDEDRKILDRFFQYLLRDCPFGYTLFGDKPVSVANVSSKFMRPVDRLVFEKGWQTWQTYQHLFPSDQFTLKKELETDEFEIQSIWIVHKQHALQVINENLDLFTKTFGAGFNADDFLQKFCDPQSSSEDLLFDNALLGLLLGYGRENALLFCKEYNIQNCIEKRMTPPFSSKKWIEQLNPPVQRFIKLLFSKKFDLSISSSISSEWINELNRISEIRNTFDLPGNDYHLSYFSSPNFVMYGYNSELIKHYEAIRLKLRESFLNQPFMEVVLQQWMKPK